MIASLILSLALQSPDVAGDPVGLLRSEDGVTPGFVLIAPLKSNLTFLIDKATGKVAHKWSSSERPGNSVYLMDNGDLLRTTSPGGNPVFKGGGSGGGLQRIAWDGTLLWEWAWSDDKRLAHHDIAPMPNGNILLISWEQKSAEEAFAVGRDPEELSDKGMWPDYVVELQTPEASDGSEAPLVVWEWHAWDHLVQDRSESKADFGVVADSPGRIDINGDLEVLSPEQLAREAELEEDMRGLGYIGDGEKEAPKDGAGLKADDKAEGEGKPKAKGGDWLHTNSIDYDPVHDLIVLSCRVFSEVWIIDHSTSTAEAATGRGGRFGKGGDLLWRWGNPQRYGAGSPEDQQLFKQHDARFIPMGSPGAGNLMIYNNGEGRPSGSFSTVVELDLPLDPSTPEFTRFSDAHGPNNPTWQVGAPQSSRELSFFSSFISGAQRLESGNTMICSGAKGRLLEVDPDGALVWEYVSPFRAPNKGRRPPGFGGPPSGAKGGPVDAPDTGAGGPAGGPPGSAPGGAPRGGGPPGGGPGNGLNNAIFRATHIGLDHPGLDALGQSEQR